MLVIGAAGVDIVGSLKSELRSGSSTPGQIRSSFGGVARNVAENLAHMGQPVMLVTAIGEDEAGDRLLDDASSAGVDVSAVLRTSRYPTGTYLAIVDAAGLDLEMRHALTRALAEYEGSLVVVSHDRALLRTVCDGFILVADGRALEFDGDIDDYLAWLAARRSSAGVANATQAEPTGRDERRAQREQAAAERQARLARRRPLVKESDRLEKTMAKLEEEKRELERKLGDAGFYANTAPADVHAASRRCADVVRLLGEAEERWLAVQSELESIGEP